MRARNFANLIYNYSHYHLETKLEKDILNLFLVQQESLFSGSNATFQLGSLVVLFWICKQVMGWRQVHRHVV